MLKNLKHWLLGVVVLLLLAVIAGGVGWLPVEAGMQLPVEPRAASASYQLDVDVIGQGSTTMHSSTYELHGTVGQTAVTTMQNDTYTLQNGYWRAVMESIYQVMLPLIRKE